MMTDVFNVIDSNEDSSDLERFNSSVVSIDDVSIIDGGGTAEIFVNDSWFIDGNIDAALRHLILVSIDDSIAV